MRPWRGALPVFVLRHARKQHGCGATGQGGANCIAEGGQYCIIFVASSASCCSGNLSQNLNSVLVFTPPAIPNQWVVHDALETQVLQVVTMMVNRS